MQILGTHKTGDKQTDTQGRVKSCSTTKADIQKARKKNHFRQKLVMFYKIQCKEKFAGLACRKDKQQVNFMAHPYIKGFLRF